MRKIEETTNIIKRVYAKEFEGISLVSNSMFYWLFECENKQFFILKDIWSNFGHPFNNKDIRDTDGHVFEMWNGENEVLDDIPCLGTNFYMEQVHCWGYSEVEHLGWTEEFYNKVVNTLYKRFEGYYGGNVEEIVAVDDFIALIKNGRVNVLDTETEEYYWMTMRSRRELDAEKERKSFVNVTKVNNNIDDDYDVSPF